MTQRQYPPKKQDVGESHAKNSNRPDSCSSVGHERGFGDGRTRIASRKPWSPWFVTIGAWSGGGSPRLPQPSQQTPQQLPRRLPSRRRFGLSELWLSDGLSELCPSDCLSELWLSDGLSELPRLLAPQWLLLPGSKFRNIGRFLGVDGAGTARGTRNRNLAATATAGNQSRFPQRECGADSHTGYCTAPGQTGPGALLDECNWACLARNLTGFPGVVQRWVTVSPVACDRKTGRFR